MAVSSLPLPALLGPRLLPALLVTLLASAAAADDLAGSTAEGDQPTTSTGQQALAKAGYGLLKKYCARCHGDRLEVPGLDVLDRAALIEGDFLRPGDLAATSLWQRVGIDGDMPPEGESPRPSAEELKTLQAWVLGGAPYPALGNGRRTFVSRQATLQAMQSHLRQLDSTARPFTRYFTLTNLNNNSAQVSDDEYRLYQAALSKSMNSLSWEPRIVVPRAVDESGTLFAIDTRDFGWDERNLWRELTRVYPYGLRFDEAADPELQAVAEDVYRLSGTKLPALRADWFIATATRPDTTTSELYHLILDLPQTAAELEETLGVNVQRNFARDRLARAGFATSGVSEQNRMVERHDSRFGSYWKSYDFKQNAERGDLLRFPLGPKFKDNPFERQAFVHDGGEMIFSLPNGLHGYLLTDGKDQRINAGPIEVVSDSLKTAGTPVIVNGLSCMACHKLGPKRWSPAENIIRGSAGVFGRARKKLELLYPPRDTMQSLIDRDERQYLAALEQAIGPFLKVGEDADRSAASFPEPVGAVARRYLRDMTGDAAAAELGFQDARQLAAAVKASSRLRAAGLGPLAAGQKIKREAFDSRAGGLSLFQRTASELDLGVPVVFFGD